MATKNTHGGKRAGAGGKVGPAGPTVKVGFMVSIEVSDEILKTARGKGVTWSEEAVAQLGRKQPAARRWPRDTFGHRVQASVRIPRTLLDRIEDAAWSAQVSRSAEIVARLEQARPRGAR